jgi:hypothetical protein
MSRPLCCIWSPLLLQLKDSIIIEEKTLSLNTNCELDRMSDEFGYIEECL